MLRWSSGIMREELARGDDKLPDFLNSWKDLKKKDKADEYLLNYWILGQGATEKEPRWSVSREVLHWLD